MNNQGITAGDDPGNHISENGAGDDPAPANGNGAKTSPQMDFVSGLILFLVSAYALYESVYMPHFAEGFEGYLSSPGLTPGLLSVGLLIMSTVLMWRGRRFTLGFNIARPNMESWRMMLALFIVIGYVILLKAVGYVIATFLMMATFQTVFSRRRSPKYILIWCIGLSAVLTAVLYYIFAEIFLIPMP